VITVASTDPNDYRSSWSNYGSCVDIFAPGNSITSAFNTSDYATRVMGGTSMAAPHVAGAAALYLSAHPSASPSSVQSALLSNSTYGYVKNASGTPTRLIYTGFISSSSTTTSDPTLSDPTSNTSGSSDPTASFTYSCSGTTCTFDASASTAPLGLLSRTWMFGDGSQAGSAKVTKTYAKSGTYTVKFYIYDVKMNYDVVTKSITTGTSGSGGSETSTSTSSTTWTYKCGTNRVCDFDARALEDAGGSAFCWYFGDGSQAGSTKLTKTYSKAGTYTVKFYIYDVKMNYAVVTKSVTTGTSGTGSETTTTSPTSSTTWSYKCGTNRVCDFDARALEDAGGYAFSWYFGDGTQAGSSHVAEKWYAKSGSYTVKMTMVKDGKVVTLQKTVSVP
jgi:hypothetical protein